MNDGANRSRGNGGASLPLRQNAYFWMTLAQSGFACMNVLARLAHAHAPWAEVAAVRASIGALVALSVARSRGSSLVIHKKGRAWERSLFGTASVLAIFYVLGSPAIHVGDIATISATTPIMLALLAPVMLGEPGGRRVWISAGVAFAGVVLIAQPTLTTAGHLVLVALAAALSSALAMISLRRVGPGESPEAIALHFSLVSMSMMLAVAAPNLIVPDVPGALVMVGTGLAGGFGQIAMTRAYALGTAARVGVFSYVGVVLTQVLAVVVLGEGIGVHEIGGALAVIGAGVYLTRDRRANHGGE